jgi:hypothetical protein
VLTSLLVLPVIASAQSTSASIASLEQELQSLIAEITQLQQSATSTPAVTTTAPAADTTASSGIICPNLVRTLSLGDSGTDVANLQGFLAQNPLIYPEQSVTGYFNMYTQDAVQRWQTAYNVVSSGTPATTGYGVVGPHTRAAILASCANNNSDGQSSSFTIPNSASQSICPVAPEPSTSCLGTWSPLTNTTGCTIAWQCTVQLPDTTTSVATSVGPSLTATVGPNSPYLEMFSGTRFPTGTYTIYYGDGVSNTVTATCPSANSSSPCGTFSASHVYVAGGTYTATIVDSSGVTDASAIVAIIATGVSYTNTQVIFAATALEGTAPLPITFTIIDPQGSVSNYAINFGDGSSGSTWSSNGGVTSFVQDHTYTAAGTYTATLVSSGGSVVGTVTITVAAPVLPVISSITPTAGPNGTSVTITGSGFIQGMSACGQGCTGGGIAGGTLVYVDGRVMSAGAYVAPTTLTFVIGMFNAGNGVPAATLNDVLTVGTHQIYVTTPNGTSSAVTFNVTK